MGDLVGRTPLELQRDTTACYVCGPRNNVGLHVPFAPAEMPDGARGARGEYIARDEHCGWPGMLHGGVAFALMDEALAYALYFHDLFGVTARAETRFRQPIAPGAKLIVRAWIVELRRRLVSARAEIRLDNDAGPVVAEVEATMYLESEPASKPRA
jgi:acyl-coenzyme A thioesterase PaaI-like protein